MTRLFLIRHGETEWNRNRLRQGRSDNELNRRGHLQSREAARLVSDIGLTAVYCSDLKRALQTAETIASPQGLNVIREPNLREIDEGDWEGLTEADISRRWPQLWERRAVARRPGGESPETVRRRALRTMREILARHPSQEVAVVTHQEVIRILLSDMLEPAEFDAARFEKLGNCAILSIEATLERGRPLGTDPTLLTLESQQGPTEIRPTPDRDSRDP